MPLLFCWLAAALVAGAMDLRNAVIVASPNAGSTESKAVRMLVEEVAKRTGTHWPVVSQWPTSSAPVIAVGLRSSLHTWPVRYTERVSAGATPATAEGFQIAVEASEGPPAVLVIGADPRGVLFGVGRLLRELRMKPGRVTLPDAFAITTAPQYPLRGHQLGYRPKTNSYDAWDLDRWEQYFRDLAVFGCNAIELIPPRSDDAATSPHFPRPPMEMMVGMSRLADEYGIDVWIWYPAMDRDYADPATVESALKEWGEVFAKLPRIDAVFVPGGDPGHTQPKVLMALLAKQTENLRRFHPKAQMWVSPQGFTQEWLDEFIGILRHEQPAWLSGVVFGPQVRVSLPRLRALVPARYPIRHYPDITHSRQCQYPVPDWDTAFAVTEGRECINPRPLDQAAIFRLLQPHTVGFLTYSEGCNDDVNKFIWSALGWHPDADVAEVLRQYSRYFIGERFTDDFAQGLLALERNWRGSLRENAGVETTLRQFQKLERRAGPELKANWRFQMALYRAYYDAYTRRRLAYENKLETRAMRALRRAARSDTLAAMSRAESLLDRAVSERTAARLRARVFELAEALHQSIGMQLSVSRYKAIAVDRGANLDTLDWPLNSRLWLKARFAELRKLPDEAGRRRGLEEILSWTDPGPGGFYDDLGNVSAQPHLVAGLPYAQDPAFLESPHAGFEEGDQSENPEAHLASAPHRSWIDHAESMNDAPLRLRYAKLDPAARYKVRVVYAGDSPRRKIRLLANDALEIHPLMDKPSPVRPIEFDLPAEATRKGTLTLSWTREPGLGGNGRGCQVSEVWLIKR
ncbi:MAG: hypothetical protein HYY24_06785 [Verrucomicrobia bacterium]|nr:hypothetical protein [Verrucomicrobiota bacterium]